MPALNKNSVYTALTLAPKGTFTFVTDPSQADVFVLNGDIPDPAADCSQAGRQVQVLCLSWDRICHPTDVQTALGIPLSLEPRTDAVSLTDIKVNDPARQADHLERCAAGAGTFQHHDTLSSRPAPGQRL